MTSFEQWVMTSQRRLLSYAHLLCGDREEAREVVQDVYANLASRFARLQADGALNAYTKRSITNAVISRRRKRRVPTVALAHDPALPHADDAVPDRVVAWQLCAELPQTQRAAVVLRFWDDASYAEIGEVLSISESTARSHVHRALAALRKRLVEEDQP